METSDNGFKIALPNQNINGSITDIDFNDKNVAIMNLFMKQSIIQWRDVETTFRLSLTMAGRLLRGSVDKELFVLLTAETRYEKF